MGPSAAQDGNLFLPEFIPILEALCKSTANKGLIHLHLRCKSSLIVFKFEGIFVDSSFVTCLLDLSLFRMLIFHILEHKAKLTFCDAYQAVLTFRSELGEDAVAKSSAKEATNLLLAKVQGFSFESSSPLAAPNFQKLIKRLKSRKNEFRPIKEDSGDETFASSDSIFQSEEDSLFNFASIRCVFDLFLYSEHNEE